MNVLREGELFPFLSLRPFSLYLTSGYENLQPSPKANLFWKYINDLTALDWIYLVLVADNLLHCSFQLYKFVVYLGVIERSSLQIQLELRIIVSKYIG